MLPAPLSNLDSSDAGVRVRGGQGAGPPRVACDLQLVPRWRALGIRGSAAAGNRRE